MKKLEMGRLGLERMGAFDGEERADDVRAVETSGVQSLEIVLVLDQPERALRASNEVGELPGAVERSLRRSQPGHA